MKTFILAIVVGLIITNAWAEHEVDHRYNIRGYILDENQQGISNQNVSVYDGSSLLAQSKTDSAGYYSLRLHLHNADNRKTLRIHAGSNEVELRVTFDATDNKTDRVHELNIIAGKQVEGELNRFRMPYWIYPVGGLLAIGLIAVFLEKRRKKKLRLKSHKSVEKTSTSKRKQKKRRRKKH